ncbi:MAG: hypothetical protein H6825_15010 [Planctomycetes bacterium]|nr:hypothetical protein [Planctomycetota bacterium]
MAADLSGLERTAARFGLALRARTVEPDPRTAAWFTVRGDELLVSERVLERLRPLEAEALLLLQLVRARALRRAGLRIAGATVLCTAAAAIGAMVAPAYALACFGGAGLLALLLAMTLWSRASMAADDESIVLFGDADTVVRAMNMMNLDEIHVGGRKLAARPDLRARADRLVRVHELRLPPGMRHTACPLPDDARDASGGG